PSTSHETTRRNGCSKAGRILVCIGIGGSGREFGFGGEALEAISLGADGVGGVHSRFVRRHWIQPQQERWFPLPGNIRIRSALGRAGQHGAFGWLTSARMPSFGCCAPIHF